MTRQPTGTEIIAALKKATVWGTPVAAGFGDGIYILNEGLEASPEVLFDDSLGNSFDDCSDLGNITDEGDIEAMIKYEGLLLPFALALGLAGEPDIITNGYQHYLLCADNIEGLFATFAIDKATAVHEHPSVKIAGFTISGEAGGYLTVTFNIIADTLDTESSTNTLATMTAVTFILKCGNIVFNNGIFLLKDHSGAAPVDPGDRINPSSFELSFTRNVSGDFVADGTRAIIEPQQDGKPEIILALSFPRYTDTRYLIDLFSKQEHELIATWTGDVIGGGPDSFEFSIECPKLVLIDSNAPASGLGKIPFTVNYRVTEVVIEPTGFQNTSPVTLGFINSISTDPLA